MPKIPVYGRQVELGAGSLGPRADSGTFEAPFTAAAAAAKTAGNIAYEFIEAEKKREDARITSEEYAAAFDSLTTSVFNDKSTNVEDAKKNFDALKTEILTGIDSKNYGRRRTAIVKQGLQKMFLQKELDFKQEAYKRGRVQAGAAHDLAMAKGFEGLRTTSVDDPLFEFKAASLRDLAASADRSGLPSRFNIANTESEISSIRTNNVRSGVQNQIANAAKADLVAIEKNIPNLKLSAPDESVLRNQIKVREGELDTEQVARFASYISVDNVGNTNFDTVESLEDKIAKARTGNFGADTALSKEWESLSKEQRVKVEKAWQERLQIARSTADYKRKVADKNEADKNASLYQDATQKIYSNSELAISTIQNMDFKGTNGEALRSQLIDLAGRRARGEILTDSKPGIAREVDQKLWQGQITRIDQRFTLSTDSPEVKRAGGKSLLERQGNELSDKDVADANTYLERKRNEADSDENKQYIRNDTRFRAFLDGYKDKIIGNPAFAKLNLKSDARFYDFSVQMRERFFKGIEEGKSPNNLLNPRHGDFIIQPDETWTPTTQELMREIADSLQTQNQIPNAAQYGPPARQAGQSVDEWRNSAAYTQWRTGPNYPKWIELQQAGASQ